MQIQKAKKESENENILFYEIFLPYPMADDGYLYHYSKNEIVLLNRRPIKLFEEWEEYFSHLTGVVIINSRSLAAERLGGADFDGDTVLVVNDKNIVSCVTREMITYQYNRINYKYLRRSHYSKRPCILSNS